MNQSIPAPAPPPMSPPIGGGGGFSAVQAAATAPFAPPPGPPPIPPMPVQEKGGLPIKVIASIQGIYAKEEQKQAALQGLDPGLALQPGWGGQGR